MRIIVRVKPSSSQNAVEHVSDSDYIVRTTAPSTEGKANRAIIKLLSEYFDVPKSRISISAGHASRSKIITIQ